MVARNALGHFTQEVLRGETRQTLWSFLLNAFFRRDTQTESWAALEAWAKENDIHISWDITVNSMKKPDRWVYFLAPKDRAKST